MRKNPVEPGRSLWPGSTSRRRMGAHGLRASLTPVRVIVGVLTLALLVISAIVSLSITSRSYARTTIVLDACVTVTAAPTFPVGGPPPATTTATATSTPQRTSTSTPRPRTPTPVSTTPTAVGTTPTVVSTTPVDTPTDTPTDPPGTSTSGQTSAGQRGAALLNSDMQNPDNNSNGAAVVLKADVPCTSTTTPSGTQTPEANPTNAPAVISTPDTSLPPGNRTGGKGGNGNSPVGLIVGGVVLVLLAGLGIGWFFFRRMLLPQSTGNTNLPPSGAGPWSRTRMSNPDSVSGLADTETVMDAGLGNFALGGLGPNMPPGPPMNNGYNGSGPGGFGSGGNGAGFGGFSDGFIPPSPQIFPQGENSMIPPGSGAFPVTANANGFAPASPAFNAMYGFSDGGNGNGFGGPPSPPQNGGSFAPGPVDLNDPYLAEVIRQYSQKGQNAPPQMSPNGPPSQMPPNGPPQMSPNGPPQMPPNAPLQMSPNGPPQRMSPNGPPQRMSPNGPPSQMPLNGPPQMSPNGPPQRMPLNGPPPQVPLNGPPQMPPNPSSAIPQRESRPGFQNSNWLQ